MTIKQVLNSGSNKLNSALDAEVLLSFVLKKPKSYLFVHMNKEVNANQQKKFLDLARKRSKGWPVAYLTGEKEFFGYKFFVNKKVLIPRPETEILAELVLDLVKRRLYKKRSLFISPLKILDVGTGSGCIIISLAKTLKNSPPREGEIEGVVATRPPLTSSSRQEMRQGISRRLMREEISPQEEGNFYYASDVSKEALAVAKKNAKFHQVKINFKQGSLLHPWKNQKFDIIVANLPYGWNKWKNNTSAETVGLKFEPKGALFTDKMGLALYEELFKQMAVFSPPFKKFPTSPAAESWENERGSLQAPKKTSPSQLPAADEGDNFSLKGGGLPKFIFLEFDPRQTKKIKNLAHLYLPGFEIKIHKDLAERNRIIQLSVQL